MPAAGEIGDYERGLAYLGVSKRITALARKLDPDEAEQLRRAADRLTERGLSMVIHGARELSAALKRAAAAAGERPDV